MEMVLHFRELDSENVSAPAKQTVPLNRFCKAAVEDPQLQAALEEAFLGDNQHLTMVQFQ